MGLWRRIFYRASSFSGGRGLPPVHSVMPVRIAGEIDRAAPSLGVDYRCDRRGGVRQLVMAQC
jgi:hypothetical protein